MTRQVMADGGRLHFNSSSLLRSAFRFISVHTLVFAQRSVRDRQTNVSGSNRSETQGKAQNDT